MPSHLLISRQVMTLPDPVTSKDSDKEVKPMHSADLNLTLNRFWKHWKNKCLLELREAHRHSMGTDAIPVQVRVVVHCDNQPRGFWKLAKLEQTITSQDGKMRGDERNCSPSCKQ